MNLTTGAGTPGDRAAGAAVAASAEGGERLGGADVPGSLGDFELLGQLVGVLVVEGAGRLLVLVHPLLVGDLLLVLVLKVLRKTIK